MKKLLLGFLITSSLGANAQLFSESFDASIPSAWTIHDEDGLASSTGQSAFASWAWNSTANDASSSSWYNNSGLGPTDDWLITPGIAVPSSGTYQLEFDATSHEANYLEEYEVLYSSTGTSVADFTSAPLISVVDESATGTFRTVVLPAATSGQTVYIAFHHTSNDESMLHIDNVVVKELLPNDIEMVALTFPSITQAGNLDITGTVKNNGANTITTFDISYNDGSGPVTETFNQTLNAGDTYSFTHGTPLAVNVSNSPYSIEVCADLTGDGNNSNDCQTNSLSVSDGSGTKLPLAEVFTSSTCPPCYSLNVQSGYDGNGLDAGLSSINANVFGTAQIAAIKYQVNWPGSGDHAYNAEGGTRVSYYNVLGAPTQVLDGASGTSITPATVSSASNNFAILDIDAEFTLNGDDISVSATVTPYADVPDAVIHIALLEKEYNATSDGSFSNGETTFHNVMRKMLPNASGTATALISGTDVDVTESYTRTVNVGLPSQGSFDFHAGTELEVIVFVQDANTKEVYNAAIAEPGNVGLDESQLSFGVKQFPNPTTGVSNVVIDLKDQSNVEIEVVNLLGEIVFQNSATANAGLNSFNINLTDQSEGMYLANVKVNNQVKTIKISVAR